MLRANQQACFQPQLIVSFSRSVCNLRHGTREFFRIKSSVARLLPEIKEMAMRCASCGKGVFSAATVCPFCHQPLSGVLGAAKSAPARSYVPKINMKIARWQIVLVAAIAIAGFASVFVFWATSGLVEPIQRQLDAFKHNDLRAAYAETSTSFQQDISLEKFSELVKSVPSLSHNVSHSFTSRSSSTNADGTGTGDVIGSITDDQGGVVPVHYELVKENGAWKIKGIHFRRKVAG